MSLNNFAKIVTNGLVFSYDSSSIQSYKGPPLTNLIASKSPLTASGTGYSFVGRTELTKVPYFGAINCSVVDIQNNYSAVSTWCCPNPMSYGSATVSPSTTYTYLIMYKCDSGYTNSNYMYRYEYTASGGSYVTEQGVHNDANRVNMGDGWYYAWGTFTTSATTNYLTGLASFYYRYSTLYDTFKVAKVALVQGNYAGLHPKYWPEHSQTRTNTQTLVDVFGNNTITASSLTYASDGTFSFNGSSNYISTTTTSFSMYCLDIWYYNNNAIPNNDTAIGGPSTYQSMIQFNNAYPTGVNLGGWTGGETNEAIQIWTGTASVYASTYNREYVASGWHNVVFNWNGSTYDIWTDGVKTTTYTMSGGATLQTITSLQIGYSSPGYYFNGKLAAVKCYNSGLSDSQVKQNFNALRGRYGI